MSKTQEAVKALYNFKQSAFALNEAIDNVLLDNPNTDLSDDYPFQLSFDEMIYEIANWVDTQTTLLTEK